MYPVMFYKQGTGLLFCFYSLTLKPGEKQEIVLYLYMQAIAGKRFLNNILVYTIKLEILKRFCKKFHRYCSNNFYAVKIQDYAMILISFLWLKKPSLSLIAYCNANCFRLSNRERI
jgi:hypothetical protein